MFLGLRTVIYPATDLAAAKAFFTSALGVGPYFDEPFYVGFDVGGYELGLDPNADASTGPVSYWGVADIDVAVAHLGAHGATLRSAIDDVGEGIRVATLTLPGSAFPGSAFPGSTVLGIIENPHFAAKPVESAGPGK